MALAVERARLEVRLGRFRARVITVLRRHTDAARDVQQMKLGIGDALGRGHVQRRAVLQADIGHYAFEPNPIRTALLLNGACRSYQIGKTIVVGAGKPRLDHCQVALDPAESLEGQGHAPGLARLHDIDENHDTERERGHGQRALHDLYEYAVASRTEERRAGRNAPFARTVGDTHRVAGLGFVVWHRGHQRSPALRQSWT